MNIHPAYSLSMTGVHGAGKKTLQAHLCEASETLRPVPLKLFQLGRMIDLEALYLFRSRCHQQHEVVEEIAEAGHHAVTSRLGILDVAIYACAMQQFGRIPASEVIEFLEVLSGDLERLHLPHALIAMFCDAAQLQERLVARDAQKKLKAARGLKKLERMVNLVRGIFIDAIYPHPLVAAIVEHYRTTGALLVLDTTMRDPVDTYHTAHRFLIAQEGLSFMGTPLPSSPAKGETARHAE